ncbi:hypothetical protein HYR99_06285 [Candidatus Poribacteria bacterium]|nr:hypothetical protein [Candidatus Poribacteria bacterium]
MEEWKERSSFLSFHFFQTKMGNCNPKSVLAVPHDVAEVLLFIASEAPSGIDPSDVAPKKGSYQPFFSANPGPGFRIECRSIFVEAHRVGNQYNVKVKKSEGSDISEEIPPLTYQR